MKELASASVATQKSRPGRFVLGMGCERGTQPDEALLLVRQAMRLASIDAHDIAALASIDSRLNEPAVRAIADLFGVSLATFDAARLEQETPRLLNPSERVFARVGCHGVAEAAALAVAGPVGELVLGKIKSASATVAIARIGSPDVAEK
ncbi:cobalamin biosynthesis protein [Rhizobium sp. BK251]|uniref:cobalamin biosynthesis protein n=1 Tax=Rhizobium sp. BK251 TaxID=2512125 RepID=UPI00104D4397|nr:cobalamin biosynthesis protein [Rhizobium sp. BK251]TCL73888.1 cobalt-precorrin 5A hydrolase [Rhizobium sp. BK251]